MPDQIPRTQSDAQRRLKALSRWDNEGGAGPDGPQEHSLDVDQSAMPPLTNAELVQLRVRVIALENLMIMMLAKGDDQQLELARKMAAYISPRPGFTHHPLTTQAGLHIVELIDRAVHYRNTDPS